MLRGKKMFNNRSNFNNMYRICIVLLISVFVISCKQQSTDSATGNSADDGNAVETTVSMTTPAAAVLPTVSLSENNIQVAKDGTVSIDIVMNDFPLTEGGGVTVRYNPALLQANKVTVSSDSWTFVNQTGDIDNAAGVISNILVSSYKGVSGDDVIATVEFRAKNNGNGKIDLELSTKNPFSINGKEIDVRFENSEISVSAGS